MYKKQSKFFRKHIGSNRGMGVFGQGPRPSKKDKKPLGTPKLIKKENSEGGIPSGGKFSREKGIYMDREDYGITIDTVNIEEHRVTFPDGSIIYMHGASYLDAMQHAIDMWEEQEKL